MNRFMYKLMQFMSGRYGMDQLNVAITVAYFITSVVTSFFRNPFLQLIPYIFLVLFIWRTFSKKIAKRYAENQVFLRYWNPIWNWLKNPAKAFKEHRLYRYYACPTCKQKLRVPRKKGKIRIRCPKCGTEFLKKT